MLYKLTSKIIKAGGGGGVGVAGVPLFWYVFVCYSFVTCKYLNTFVCTPVVVPMLIVRFSYIFVVLLVCYLYLNVSVCTHILVSIS